MHLTPLLKAGEHLTLSFAQLWEQIEQAKSSPLMSSGEDSKSLTVLRTGNDFHEEGQTPFWDELISLCSNAEGLGDLLGVSPDKVRSWPSRIKGKLEKLEKQQAQNPAEKQDTEMIPTGSNGAFTTNTDPMLGGF